MKKTVISLLIVILAIAGYRLLSSSPKITNPNPSGENIICFGDSLTSGVGASKGMDYPSQLSQMISQPIINAGIPGDTTKSALNRLEADVLSQSPRIVLITLGGNDLKNGVSREAAFDNLKRIVVSIQEEGALVIMGGIDFPVRGRGFGDAYEELCDAAGCVLIPDIFDGIMGKPKLMSDPIHPNNQGYRIMAEKCYEKIEPFL